MTYKEKYEDLDRSKLPEKAIVIIDTMKKDSKGFTDTEALEIVGPKFDQVIAKLKSSGYEEAFKSMQKKEPEPKTPVAKAKKIVEDAVKQPKTTSTKAKPTVGAFKKGAVGELAKQIRKEGEAWPSALKRAGQIIKDQKSGVQKKATAQYKKLTALLAKMPELGKGTDVERDSARKAKPIGKRTAKSGSTYYEYRANRTDVRQGKGYPYLKLGAMLSKGGEIEKIYDKVQMFDEITEKEISAIIKRMNDAKGPKNFDAELQKMVDWVWDNEPRLSKEQNAKGIKSLKNIAFMANGKSRSNSPFGSREEYTLKNFAYFKLRGFHDVSLYGRVEQYVPLYTAYDDEGYGFEYFYYNGKVNVVGEKGMTIKKKSKVEVDFFDSDKKVQDFLNLSKVQFLARYKETKERYQQIVNAITRNIEGVFMHGGKMSGAGQFANGGEMNNYEGLMITLPHTYTNKSDLIGDIEAFIGDDYEDNGDKIFVRNKDIYGHGVTLSQLQDLYDYIENNYGQIQVEMFAKGGHMAKGGMMADGGETSKRYFLSEEDDDGYYYIMDSQTMKKVPNTIFEREDVKGWGKIKNKFIKVRQSYSRELRVIDAKHIIMILNDDNFAKGGHMAKGGMTNLEGTTTPKAYPMGEPDINVVV